MATNTACTEENAKSSGSLLTVHNPQFRFLSVLGDLLFSRADAVPDEERSNRIVEPERFGQIADLCCLPNEPAWNSGTLQV